MGRPGRAVFFFLIFGLALAGCRNRDAELLEGELRSKEIHYREALDELKNLQHHNLALYNEIQALRQGTVLLPEHACHVHGLKRITLGRGTGGYDRDQLPGDEALYVVVEPRDGEDHIVKVPAEVHVAALEITSQGNKIPLSSWELGPEQLRKMWKGGLFSTGYFLVLPWKSWPTQEQVRVVAKLVLSDGRVFETDKDVQVRVLPHGPQPSPAPHPYLPPAPGPELPLPRKVEETTANRSPWLRPGTNRDPVSHAARWQPAPLAPAIQLGPPTPLTPGD